jgi:hypothetical protein
MGAKDKHPRKRKGEFRYTNVEGGIKIEFTTPKGTVIQFDKKYANIKEAEEASNNYLKWRESLKKARTKGAKDKQKRKTKDFGDFVSIRDIVGAKRWKKMGKEHMKPMKGIPADWGEE